MTIPSTIVFPLRKDFADLEDIDRYFQDLIFELQRMYERLAEGINGSIRTDALIQKEQWVPILKGTGVAGTFTYVHQIGIVLQQGLMVDCWFDVSWSGSGAAAGNLYVELPYLAAISTQMPFVGAVQHSSIVLTGGTDLLVNAIPSTYRGEFWYTGNGVATGNQTIVGSGRTIGHLRYLRDSNE